MKLFIFWNTFIHLKFCREESHYTKFEMTKCRYSIYTEPEKEPEKRCFLSQIKVLIDLLNYGLLG